MNNNYIIDIKLGYEMMDFTITDSKLDLSESFDLLSIYPVKIEVLETNGEEESEKKLVATIIGYYFDLDYMRDENISLFEIFDGINQNIYDMYVALFDKEEYRNEFEVINENLFYLDTIVVEEDYRRNGYCKMLVEQLYEILRYIAKLNIGVIATSIYQYETNDNFDSIDNISQEEKEKINKSLINLFKKNNYKETSKDDTYLVRIF